MVPAPIIEKTEPTEPQGRLNPARRCKKILVSWRHASRLWLVLGEYVCGKQGGSVVGESGMSVPLPTIAAFCPHGMTILLPALTSFTSSYFQHVMFWNPGILPVVLLNQPCICMHAVLRCFRCPSPSLLPC